MLRLLRRLRPLRRSSLVSAASSGMSRATEQGSHVPAFDLLSRRRRALALAILDDGIKECAVVGSNGWLHQPAISRLADSDREYSQPHLAFWERWQTKYRAFRRTLRCLAIGHAVARPIDDGDVRYSSDHQLFRRTGGTRCTWMVPFDPSSFLRSGGVAATGQTPAD